MKGWPKPSSRFREYVRKLHRCGHWEVDSADGHTVILRHASGRTVAYQTHDGGNEYNGARNFATEAGSICGCLFVEPRGRKRSRKAVEVSGYSPYRSASEDAAIGAVDAMSENWHRLDMRLQEIEAAPSRALIPEARRVVTEMSRLADAIEDLHHPRPTRA